MKNFLLSVLLCLFAFSVQAQVQQRRVAVILFNFQDNPTAQPFTSDAARSMVFTSNSSSAYYYNEVSFGKLNITSALRSDGDVFGWYTVPYNNSVCATNQPAIYDAARTLAANDGFVATNYDIVIYGFVPNGTGCGLGSFGVKILLPSDSFKSKIITHEMGHSFSRSHANAWDCTSSTGERVALSNNCTTIGVGNPFTVMGGSYWGHMNVFEKNMSGGSANLNSWLLPSNIQTVTAAGDYTLVPIEQNTTAVQGLRFPRNGQDLYVEYRRPIGLDSNNNYIRDFVGPLLFIANIGSSETFLLNPNPESSDDFRFLRAALVTGKTFTDPVFGINITTLVANDSFTTVRVSFFLPVCTPNQVVGNPPTCDCQAPRKTYGNPKKCR